MIFSSHKQHTSEEIIKDFEPPIYGIMVEIDNDGIGAMTFVETNDVASFSSFNEGDTKYLFDATKAEQLTRDVM